MGGRKKANNEFWKKKQFEKKNNAVDHVKRNYDRRGNKIGPKINPAISTDEVALTGATADMKGFNNNDYEGVVTQTQEDSDEQKVFKRELIENPLHKFATVNHIITLAVLDAQEINFTGLVVRNGPKYPVAQTAGRVGKDPTAFGQAGLDLEILINNLTVDAVVSPSPKNRHSMATNIDFEVIEPFSIGIFFQAMKVQAIKAYGPDADYLRVPFALIIDFKGYDDDGNVSKDDGNLRRLRRVIPIGMKQVEMSASAGGGRYACSAYPFNETAMRDAYVSIKKQVTLTGSTIHELLQTGEESLMNQLNSIGSDKKAKQKQNKEGESTPELPHESTVIFFPDPFGVDADELIPSEADIAALNEDRATVTNFGGAGDEQYTSLFTEARVADKQLTNIFSTGQNGAVNVSNFLGSTVGDGGGLRLNQGKGQNFFGNDIGKSKMLTAGTNPFNKKKFEEMGLVYDQRTKTFNRGKSTINFLNDGITMNFEKGTKVTDIIENVILFSEYGQSIGRAIERNKEPAPFVPWFRIHPQTWQLKDSYVNSLTGNNPRVFTYNVIPYKVAESMFVDPTDFSKGYDLLRASVVKKYDYIYTGTNKDILNFDINYRFTFFDAQRERPNVTSNTSDRGEGERFETEVVGNKDSKFEYFPRSQKVITAGTPLATSEDMNTRASGLEVDSPEVQVARQINEKIVNSDVDLLQLEMEIVGDTYFLPNSGLGNLIISDIRKQNKSVDFGRNEMDYLNTQVCVEVNFNTPVDINEQTGDMNLAAIQSVEKKQTLKLGVFSAIYRVIKCTSQFNGGRFIQNLSLVAPSSMTLGQKTKSTSEATQKKTDDKKKVDNSLATRKGNR